ncbi:MAG: pentapeptide repeat-containing protein [Methylophilaceae bacterium]
MAKDNKKIVNIEVLHLDDLGYGPEGKHTRRSWRQECLDCFLQGKGAFLNWQQNWQKAAENNKKTADFGLELTLEDGSKKPAGSSGASHALDFSGQVCLVNVSDYQFLQKVFFNVATFQGGAQFNKAIFQGGAQFNRAVFEGYTEFYSATFEGAAWFKDTTFDDKAVFSNATFEGYAMFGYSTIFKGDVMFDHADFKGNVEFGHATFKGDAWFNSATFGSTKVDITSPYQNDMVNGASFLCVTFKSNAMFERATFKDDAMFSYATFEGCSLFSNAKFENSSLFTKAKFQDSVGFESATFDNVGHFEGAQFLDGKAKIPSFRGCKIDETRLEFSDDSYFTQADFNEDAIKNISSLKRLADEHGQTDQALNFNAMELRAKRKFESQNLSPGKHQDADALLELLSWRVWVGAGNFFKGKYWFCMFTWLYEVCSDFGRSFTRPLFLLITFNIITFLLCLYAASPNVNLSKQSVFSALSQEMQLGDNHQISISAFRAATEYSIYKTGNFLDFSDNDKRTEVINQRLFGSEVEPGGIRAYGFLKGLFSAILIFLIGLGIRNKYRVS